MASSSRKCRLLRLAAALGVAGLLIVSQIASATHVRPRGATPIRASLVPAFKACATPNRTHGTPLAFPSCNPPVQESNFLTVGTPDANGAGANSIASITFSVNATTGEVIVTPSISDVRCKPATDASVCSGANAASGPDYSGDLQSNMMIRISDHDNGPNRDEAATVVDIPFPVNFSCVNTADTSIGGFCSIRVPPPGCPPACPRTGTRAVVELAQIEVFDGGADGLVGTAGNTVFLRQGLFIP
jgi:hypothetical protein